MKTCYLGVLLFVTASAMFAQQAIGFDVVPGPAASDTLVFRTPLPDFEARDVAGRMWRTADLRDKLIGLAPKFL